MADGDFDKGVAVKVSLPASLVDGLQAICDASGYSKSDAVRAALERFLETNPLWINRRYFFQNLSQPIEGSASEVLKKFQSGTFVRLVGGVSYFPSSAQFFVGVVHRVQGERLYVELPMYLSRPSSLLMNLAPVQSQMSIAAEAKMVVPRFENIPNLSAWGGSTSVLMYEVHASFIWGIEHDPNLKGGQPI